MTEVAGIPWIVQKGGNLYSKVDPTTTATTASAGSVAWPTPTTQEQGTVGATEAGKLLCSGTAYTDCTNTKADYVGKYTLDLSCDSGFYDPI